MRNAWRARGAGTTEEGLPKSSDNGDINIHNKIIEKSK
jgi:hypothetical protein